MRPTNRWTAAVVALLLVTTGCIGFGGDPSPSSGDALLQPASNSTNTTNTNITNTTVFRETIPLTFTATKTPLTGVTLVDGNNCIALWETSKGAYVQEGTVTVDWTSTLGPDTYMTVIAWMDGGSDYHAYNNSQATATLNVAGWSLDAPQAGILESFIEIRLPGDMNAHVGVEATVTFDLAVSGIIGDTGKGACA